MSPGLKTNDNRNDLYQKVKTTTKYARRVPGGGNEGRENKTAELKRIYFDCNR